MSVEVDHTQEFCEALAVRWTTGTVLAGAPTDEFVTRWRVRKLTTMTMRHDEVGPHCHQDTLTEPMRANTVAEMMTVIARDAALLLSIDNKGTRVYAQCKRGEAPMDDTGTVMWSIYTTTLWTALPQ